MHISELGGNLTKAAIYLFSCFFHGSTVLQDKQAELTPVSTVPRSTGRRLRLQCLVCVCSSLSLPQACCALPRMKSSRHDCNHASSSISFESCLLPLHRPTGPLRSLPAAALEHLPCDHSITASYSLWHCQRSTEVVKSSRFSPDSRTVKPIFPDGFWRPFSFWISFTVLFKSCANTKWMSDFLMHWKHAQMRHQTQFCQVLIALDMHHEPLLVLIFGSISETAQCWRGITPASLSTFQV